MNYIFTKLSEAFFFSIMHTMKIAIEKCTSFVQLNTLHDCTKDMGTLLLIGMTQHLGSAHSTDSIVIQFTNGVQKQRPYFPKLGDTINLPSCILGQEKWCLTVIFATFTVMKIIP